MEPKVLQEQIAYYRMRAPEYRHIVPRSGPLARARQKLQELGRVPRILELAAGTGVWTQELADIGESVTAVDASPEMISINRRRVGHPRVRYQQADLFEWEPQHQYDLVFFAFWLSHVPPDLLDPFLLKVRRAVRHQGHLFMVDQCDDLPDDPLPEREGVVETRKLADGRAFTIVKVYYHPTLLACRVRRLGFETEAERIGPFFYLSGVKFASS